MQRWHPLSKLVVGLGLIGLGWIWWTERSGPPEPRAVSGAAQAADDSSAAAVPGASPAPSGMAVPGTDDGSLEARLLPPEASLAAMVSRPLFAPDRQPHDPAIAFAALPDVDWGEAAPEAGPAVPTFRFIGSIDEDGQLRAFVSDGFNVRSLVIGEEVDGWEVRRVEDRRLTLGVGEHEIELTIFQ